MGASTSQVGSTTRVNLASSFRQSALVRFVQCSYVAVWFIWDGGSSGTSINGCAASRRNSLVLAWKPSQVTWSIYPLFRLHRYPFDNSTFDLEAKGGTWLKRCTTRAVTKHSTVVEPSLVPSAAQAHAKLKPLVPENSLRLVMVSASPANPALVFLIIFSSPFQSSIGHDSGLFILI